MLDQYQLIDRIGVGGMAEVWRATMRGAEGFERPVAIKRILPQFSGDTDFVAMFVDEAKIAVRLSHPNIVQIFDLGRAGDEWFIAMELVHGKDLRAVTDAEAARGQRVPLEVACHAVMKMCEGLQHAHFLDANPLQPTAGARQIIHRDISPQNVLVSYDGEVKVTDFGLAKAAGRAAHTQAGTIKGKLAYMSPEQLRGVSLDQRSDVFAVGIVLWELLTGERLFLGQNDRDTIAKAFACKVPPLGSIDPTIDDELDRITRRALSMDRDQRYASAEELHDDLEAYVYGAGLTLSSGSLAAYMRALFPQAEAAPVHKRDRRAVTAQIQLEDAPDSGDEPLDELDGLEEEAPSEPAPRQRSYLPGAPSSIPISASDLPSELSDHDIDALEESIQYILGTGGAPPAEGSTDARSASRSALSAPALPSIPPAVAVAPPPTRASDPGRRTTPWAAEPDANPTMYDPDAVYPELEAARAAFAAQAHAQESAHEAGPRTPVAPPRDEPPSLDHPWGDDHGFDHDEGTLAFEGRFGDEDEQTPQFEVELARASLDSTHDDPDRTIMPGDEAEYAAMVARSTKEIAATGANAVGPPEEMLVTRMVRPNASDLLASRERDLGDDSAVAPVAGARSSQTMPTARPPGAEQRKPYTGFEDGEDETTTGAGTPRRS